MHAKYTTRFKKSQCIIQIFLSHLDTFLSMKRGGLTILYIAIYVYINLNPLSIWGRHQNFLDWLLFELSYCENKILKISFFV